MKHMFNEVLCTTHSMLGYVVKIEVKLSMYMFEMLVKLWRGTKRMVHSEIKRNNKILSRVGKAEKGRQSTKSCFRRNEETMVNEIGKIMQQLSS